MIYSEKQYKELEKKLKKLQKENELKETENRLLKQQNKKQEEVIHDLDIYNYQIGVLKYNCVKSKSNFLNAQLFFMCKKGRIWKR